MVDSLSLRAPAARWACLSFVIAIAVAPSACNTESVERDMAAVVDLGIDDLDATDLGPDLTCTPEVASCSGLCGPVRDSCTGKTLQCGACAAGTVCDLDAHVCVLPKKDCAELGRVCGTTKNSCGQTISCTPFTCTDPAQECDPDSNQCVACTNVTCQDLGYECGTAWLGCGPQSNTTDCGTCATDQNCNNALHVCEPKTGGTCGGMTPKQMCDAAQSARGVECGVITNGCGGLIDCTVVDAASYTCRTGTTCGGAGVPNKCAPAEPPTECYAAGYDCGTLDSACGGTVNCGTCDPTKMEVCNLAAGSTAGTCGPACTQPQKTCAADYAGLCGKALPNNCWPTLNCPCPNPGDACSSDATPGTAGTCGALKMCSMYTSGAAGQPCSTQPSPSFPKGDGSNLSCPCANSGGAPGQQVCVNVDATTKVGQCCTRTACTGNQASVVDACTGQTLNCCAPGQVSYMGQCCTPIENPCEQAANSGRYQVGVTDGCGQLVNGTGVCDCSRYGQDNPLAGPGNLCCAPPACSAGQCTGSATSSCSGRTVACGLGNCNGGQVCNGGTCCTPNSCPNDGKYYAAYPRGCGLGTMVCNCSRHSSSSLKVNPDVDDNGVLDDGGACCGTPSCGGSCAGNTVYATCNNDVFATCSTCNSNQCCNGTSCVAKRTCGGYYSGKCGTDLDNGCGMNTLDCGCPTGASCSTSATNVAGVCICPPVTCNGCNPPTQSNGCDTASCGCNGGQVCGASNTCCNAKTCSDLPPGWQCGTVFDACTNSNIGCSCPTAQKPLNTCNTGTHLCECTPIKCCKDTGGVQPCIQPGSYSPSLGYPDHNDGCGGSGTCSS